MNFTPRVKIVLSVIASTIIHIFCSILFFMLFGLNILFGLYANKYNAINFFIAAIATTVLYMVFSLVIGFIFYIFTKLDKFPIIFTITGTLFALFIGFAIYSYIWGM